MSDSTPGLNYRDAGVDINAGNALVERIKPAVKRTAREGVLGSLGGFGALFEIPLDRYQNPVLVSGTDGVGTKLRLALDTQQHNTVGIDLVAMCVNDILVQGAEPLFFLDYYATGKLDIDTAASVINGIAQGCEQAGCALTGGETAEMPGMYEDDDYDLAGFCVGIVEKNRIIDGSRVQTGDVLLGLASSGPHSNGYSLIRKIVDHAGANWDDDFNGQPLGKTLIEPTRIYVKSILPLLNDFDIHAMAHITGGGLTENLPRVLPDNCDAVIDPSSWQMPEIFQWLQKNGNVSDTDMRLTFNCGIGFVLVVPAVDADAITEKLQHSGETVYRIGEVTGGNQSVRWEN